MTECREAPSPPAASIRFLPVAGIARELLRLRQHPYLREEPVAQDEAGSETDTRHLREIFGLLRNATGVDFSLYKPGTIQRRTQRRMALLKMENLGHYAEFIRQHPDELAALFQDILINVTSFFREPATFEAIRSQVLPAIFKDRSPADPVRIWVPGCATGEEAYSIAICLNEYINEAGVSTQIQIFGTDLSEWALEKARAGVYPETIAADVSQQRLRRFFVRVNSSYQIARVHPGYLHLRAAESHQGSALFQMRPGSLPQCSDLPRPLPAKHRFAAVPLRPAAARLSDSGIIGKRWQRHQPV